MRPFLALLALALSGPALAQADLLEFLAPLQAHPRAQAAAAAVRVAQLELNGAQEPFAISLSAGVSAFAAEAPLLPPDLPGLPSSAGQFSTDLVLKPFPLPEQLEQGRIALGQALLDYRETLAALEAQALTAALNLSLTEASLAVAEEGAELAQRALAATRLRYERGAASARELRDAEAGQAEALAFVQDAQGNVALLRLTLSELLPGGTSLDVAALRLPLPSGTPLAVVRAELGLRGGELGSSVAEKALLPVLQAGYTWNLDARSSLGVSLETRTLQPRVGYAYQDPGRSFPQAAVRGSFQVGLSLSVSPASLAAAEAAAAQRQAAQAGLQATRRGAELQRQSLRNALAGAERQLEVAQARDQHAGLTLQEAQTRERLGLGSPLETQQAALSRSRSALDLASARQAVLARALDVYAFYGTPLTEVLR